MMAFPDIGNTIVCRSDNAKLCLSVSVSRVLALAARPIDGRKQGLSMFLILAIVLVVMWLGGFVMFKSAGMLIHLLLLFAVISIIMHFVTGRTAA